MEYTLRTFNLTKEYKNKAVVNNLNMNIKSGEIYGFLGKNGAGKTTTLKMILNLVVPTSGEFQLFSTKSFSNDVYGRIGSVIEYPGFYPNLTAFENLEIHRRMTGIENKSYIDDALKAVSLDKNDIKNKKVKEFSLGMKQRLGIARAILAKPEFLILDEPTNGLDPLGIRAIRETLLSLNREKGITILISSHILSEIEHLASTIGIIDRGVLLEEIEYDELVKKNRRYIRIKVNDDKRACVILEKKLNIHDYKIFEPNIIRVYESLDKSSEISKTFIQNDIDVEEIGVQVDTLEDYFVKLTGGAKNA